jgi:hypothetical protein
VFGFGTVRWRQLEMLLLVLVEQVIFYILGFFTRHCHIFILKL